MEVKEITPIHKQEDHNIFTENFIIFFQCTKNWECAGVRIWEILDGRLLEILYM